VPDKGIPELAEAWSTIRQLAPGAHLLLVGTEEHETPLPAATISLLRQLPRIHFAGFVREMGPVYAALDMVVLPSHREGLPVVLLEAAAMALPVITTRVPGCVDAVEADSTALVIDVRSPQSLAAAILRYIRDPQLRREHGAAGRERVLKLFDRRELWSAVHDEYLLYIGEPRVAE